MRSISTTCCYTPQRLLKASAETRERYNRRYRYILVDEYQDTNRPQYELMRMLAGSRAQCLCRGR